MCGRIVPGSGPRAPQPSRRWSALRLHRFTVIARGREAPQLPSAQCAHPRGEEPVRRIDCGFTPPGGDG
jgi:hypothetical protein